MRTLIKRIHSENFNDYPGYATIVPTLFYSNYTNWRIFFCLLPPPSPHIPKHDCVQSSFTCVQSSQLQGDTTLPLLQNSGIKLSSFSLQSVKDKACLLFKKTKQNKTNKKPKDQPRGLKNLVYPHYLLLSSSLLLGLCLDFMLLREGIYSTSLSAF